MEVNVEIGAELVQRLLDVLEHHVHADGAEVLLDLFLRALECLRVLLQHSSGDVLDVLSAVAIFRSRLVASGCNQGVGEAVNLATVVIEVVLAGDLGTGGRQDTTESVTDCCPASTTQVNRPGRICGDKLQVHVEVGVEVGMAPLLPRCQDVLDDLALGIGGQADVNKARACDGCFIDALRSAERCGNFSCQVTRHHADALAQLHGDIGCVVAVLRVTRTLDGRVFRHDRDIGIVGSQNLDGDFSD